MRMPSSSSVGIKLGYHSGRIGSRTRSSLAILLNSTWVNYAVAGVVYCCLRGLDAEHS